MNTNKIIVAGLAAIVGLGAVSFSTAASAQAPAPPVFRQPGQHRGGERHPELRRALRSLERTEYDLRHSASDFDGHKAKAADLCRDAEHQVQLALQSDRN